MPPKSKPKGVESETSRKPAFGTSSRARAGSIGPVEAQPARNTRRNSKQLEQPPVDTKTKESIISVLSPSDKVYVEDSTASTPYPPHLHFEDIALSPVNARIQLHMDDDSAHMTYPVDSSDDSGFDFSSMLSNVGSAVNTSLGSLLGGEDSQDQEELTMQNTYKNSKPVPIVPQYGSTLHHVSNAADIEVDDAKDKIRLQAALEGIQKDHLEHRNSPVVQGMSSPLRKKYDSKYESRASKTAPFSPYGAFAPGPQYTTGRDYVTTLEEEPETPKVAHVSAKKRHQVPWSLYLLVISMFITINSFIYFRSVASSHSSLFSGSSSHSIESGASVYNPGDWTTAMLVLEEAQKMYGTDDRQSVSNGSALVDRAKLRFTQLQSHNRAVFEDLEKLKKQNLLLRTKITGMEEEHVLQSSILEKERTTCGRELSELEEKHRAELVRTRDSLECPLCPSCPKCDTQSQVDLVAAQADLASCAGEKSDLLSEISKMMAVVETDKNQYVDQLNRIRDDAKTTLTMLDQCSQEKTLIDTKLQECNQKECISVCPENDLQQRPECPLCVQEACPEKECTQEECPECKTAQCVDKECPQCPKEQVPECTKCEQCSKCEECTKCEECPAITAAPIATAFNNNNNTAASSTNNMVPTLDLITCQENVMNLDIKMSILQDELEKVQDECDNSDSSNNSTNIVVCPKCESSVTNNSAQQQTMKPSVMLNCDEDDEECLEQQQATQDGTIIKTNLAVCEQKIRDLEKQIVESSTVSTTTTTTTTPSCDLNAVLNQMSSLVVPNDMIIASLDESSELLSKTMLDTQTLFDHMSKTRTTTPVVYKDPLMQTLANPISGLNSSASRLFLSILIAIVDMFLFFTILPYHRIGRLAALLMWTAVGVYVLLNDMVVIASLALCNALVAGAYLFQDAPRQFAK